jgi:hypothetical protein
MSVFSLVLVATARRLTTQYDLADAPGYQEIGYDEEWTVFTDKECDYVLDTNGLDESEFYDGVVPAAFKSSLCYTQGDAAAGYVETLDKFEDSPAICGTEAEIKALCWSMSNCYGFVLQQDVELTGPELYPSPGSKSRSASSKDRGYLLSYKCGGNGAYHTETGTSLYKKFPSGATGMTLANCPLGKVVVLSGGKYAAVRGTYEWQSDAEWTREDGLAKVTWHMTGCGWSVQQVMETRAPIGRRAKACEDRPSMLAAILGADKDEDVCASLQFRENAYCSSPVIAKLCAATCGECDAVDAPVCSTAQCGAPVDQVLCPQTCAGTELAMPSKEVMKKRFGELRPYVTDALLNWNAGMRKFVAARRLGLEVDSSGLTGADITAGHFEEVYRTFEHPGSSCGLTADLSKMDQANMLDVLKYHMPVPTTLDPSCPSYDMYETIPSTYCPLKNVVVQYRTETWLADHSCYTKCAKKTFSATADTGLDWGVDTIDGDTNDWCSGFHVTNFTMENTALCLPREECEAVCTQLGSECASIDMHKSRPLCYLNVGTPSADVPEVCTYADYELGNSTSFDLLTKGTTSSAYFTTITGRAPTFLKRPTNISDSPQMTSSVLFFDNFGGVNRTYCERACKEDDDCYGFVSIAAAGDVAGDGTGNYTTDCYFLSYPCVAESGKGEVCGGDVTVGNYKYLDGANWPSAVTTVLKAGGEPCTVAVNSDMMTKQEAYCTGTVECYYTEDNSTRLRFDTNVNGCDGWLLEAYAGPMEKVVLDNCTDKAAAAKMFLLDYMLASSDGLSAEVTQSSYDYPCQSGFDEGLCKDPVFFGLCPHTCAPFESVTVAGARFVYQLTDLDYEKVEIFTSHASLLADGYAANTNATNRSCIGDNDVAAFYFMKNWTTHEINSKISPKGTCNTLASYNETWNPSESLCVGTDVPYASIILSLCQKSCMEYMSPPTTTPPPCAGKECTDESSRAGARWRYNYRQLTFDPKTAEMSWTEREESRRLSDYPTTRRRGTTSDVSLGAKWYGNADPATTAIKVEGGVGDTVITIGYSQFVIDYRPGDYDAPDSWTSLLTSWVNGSDIARSVYNRGYELKFEGGVVTETFGETCPTGSSDADASGILDDVADAGVMYPMYPALSDPPAMLDYQCKKQAACPEFYSCVVERHYLDQELKRRYGSYWTTGLSSATYGERTDMLSKLNESGVLISEHRATAYWLNTGEDAGGHGQKWFKLADQVYRSAMGASKLTAVDLGDAYTALVSVAPATAGGGFFLDQQLGLELPSGYDYVSDVMRVEFFNETFVPMATAMTYEISVAPLPGDSSLFHVFKIVPDGGSFKLEEVAFTDIVEGPSSATITGTFAAGDYVLALYADHCKASPCDANAECSTDAVGAATCACKAGYAGTGMPGECAMATDQTYSSGFYVRVTHTSPLKFGWRINEINVQGCDSMLAYPAQDSLTYRVLTKFSKVYTGDFGKAFYPDAVDTWTDGCTKSSRDADPIAAKATGGYDKNEWCTFTYDPYKLVDGDDATYWQSECYECNPMTPAFVEFLLPADCQPTGIVVKQEENHAASHTIEMGAVEGPGCGVKEGEPRCAPYWVADVFVCSSSADCPKSQPQCIIGEGDAHGKCGPAAYVLKSKPEEEVKCDMATDCPDTMPNCPTNGGICFTKGVTTGSVVKTSTAVSCGVPNTQIFGEIMQIVGGGAELWEGSYANDYPVETACQCHRLCIEHVGLKQGCRSWRYYESSDNTPIKHCFLQSNIFSSGGGWYGLSEKDGWTGWTSGTPELRYIKDGLLPADQLKFDKPYLLSVVADVPASLSTNTPFNLVVTGAGLPFSTDKAEDASLLQRVKIVKKGQACYEKVPVEVKGLSCVKSKKKVDFTSGLYSKDIYTLCGPRPTMTDADSLTFAGVSIMPGMMEQEYEVCYCPFDCFSPDRWDKVPTTLKTPPAVFQFVADPPSPISRLDAADGIKITVTRPAFGSHSFAEDWKVKLVRDHFDCSKDMDPTLVLPVATSPLEASSFHSCSGPDVCSFMFHVLVNDLKDTGRFLVCFDELASGQYISIAEFETGTPTITVEALTADHTHPRGIFHNQYFSALASAPVPSEVNVAGFKIPLPSTSKITITSAACGVLDKDATYAPLVMKDLTDVTPPTLSELKTTSASLSELLMLDFSEPVSTENCTGRFLFVNPYGVVVATYPCANVTTHKNTITIKLEDAPANSTADPSLPEGTYTVVIETAALTDLAGNRITYVESTETVTVSATETDAPTVVRTKPLMGGAATTKTVELFFSEDISANVGVAARLSLCGATCKTSDPLISSYTITDDIIDGNALTFNLGSMVKELGLYMLTIPGASVNDTAGNKMAGVDYLFEFVYDPSGFDPDVFALGHEVTASTEEGLVFPVQLGETAPGTYNLCYCNDQEDETLISLGDGSSTYKLTDNAVCEETGGDEVIAPAEADVVADLCSTKCEKGCIGPDCYCDAYTDGEYSGEEALHSKALCLPKEKCKTACDMETGCVGINVHDSLPICYLISSCTPFTTDYLDKDNVVQSARRTFAFDGDESSVTHGLLLKEDYLYFAKTSGTSCTTFLDYTEQAGVITVTNRVVTGVDYVVGADEPASFEVTAALGGDLTAVGSLLSKDRVMVIDCGGTCGVSGPTKQIPGYGTVMDWYNLAPHTYFADKPWDDQDNDQFWFLDKDGVSMKSFSTYVVWYADTYMAGNNVVVPGNKKVSIDGMTRKLEDFQCYKMCAGPTPCTEPWCNCEGFLDGHDGAESNAICADSKVCGYLCDQLDECDAVDMHKTLDRCFLNTLSGLSKPQIEDAKLADDNYNVLSATPTDVDHVLAPDAPANEECHRRLDTLLDTVDSGYSWDAMLRFTGWEASKSVDGKDSQMKFSTGGTFKLCFCDSTLGTNHLGKKVSCKSEADYSIEVGKVHSSGVSCLLNQPRLRRASCATQMWGGLRCYADIAAPEPPVPPAGPLTADKITGVYADKC